MTSSVFCIVPNELMLNQIVNQLQTEGILSNDVSVLYPDKSGARDFVHEKHTKMPEGATTGASVGGVVGGGLGWLVGAGVLAIPGLGPFIAAGPILAALGGVATGATLGGLTGALVGMGIPEYEAKQYQGKIQQGNILISVHARDSDVVSKVKKIFKEAGAQHISHSEEAHA